MAPSDRRGGERNQATSDEEVINVNLSVVAKNNFILPKMWYFLLNYLAYILHLSLINKVYLPTSTTIHSIFHDPGTKIHVNYVLLTFSVLVIIMRIGQSSTHAKWQYWRLDMSPCGGGGEIMRSDDGMGTKSLGSW